MGPQTLTGSRLRGQHLWLLLLVLSQFPAGERGIRDGFLKVVTFKLALKGSQIWMVREVVGFIQRRGFPPRRRARNGHRLLRNSMGASVQAPWLTIATRMEKIWCSDLSFRPGEVSRYLALLQQGGGRSFGPGHVAVRISTC